jgi:hypothetical protein
MRGSPPPSISFAADQARTSDIRECGYLAVAKGDVNMLAFPCFHSTQKGGHDRVGGIEPSREVSDGDSNLHGWAILF